MAFRDSVRPYQTPALCLLACALAACGGGGDSSTTASSPTPAPQTPAAAAPQLPVVPAPVVVAPALPAYAPLPVSANYVPYAPSAAVAASLKTAQNVSTTFNALSDPKQGCKQPLMGVGVFEQAHTTTVGAVGVTNADTQEAASYAEAAVLELRRNLGVAAPVAFGSGKVLVCVQSEFIDNLNGKSAWVGVASGLQFVVVSPTGYLNRFGARDKTNGAFGLPNLTLYQRLFVHESMHIYAQREDRDGYRYRDPNVPNTINHSANAHTERWFEEGMGRYMELGRVDVLTKEALLASVNESNPINVVTSLELGMAGSGAALDYDAAAAVLNYLFSPTGANNPFSAYPQLMDALYAEWDQLTARCLVANPASDCPNNEAQVSAMRPVVFAAVFERIFKNKDGSPMKLRSGPNNLKDSLAARLEAFW